MRLSIAHEIIAITVSYSPWQVDISTHPSKNASLFCWQKTTHYHSSRVDLLLARFECSVLDTQFGTHSYLNGITVLADIFLFVSCGWLNSIGASTASLLRVALCRRRRRGVTKQEITPCWIQRVHGSAMRCQWTIDIRIETHTHTDRQGE